MQQTINDLFIIAARKKFRFSSSKGDLTCEDLFQLSLSTLDYIAISLDEEIQKAGRKSFVQKREASTTDIENQLEIVKFIIETKQAEIEERKAREIKAEQREFLLNLKKEKQIEQLKELSLEDIEKQLEETK